MNTTICQMLSIEAPIFAFSHCRDVVVEVSRAGGMGVLGAAGFTPEHLRQELEWISAHIDGKPFGVDLLIPGNYERSAIETSDLLGRIPANYHQFMEDYCDRNNIPALPDNLKDELLTHEYGKVNMTPETAQVLMDITIEYPIKLMVNALGIPSKDNVEKLHAKGIKVGSLVGKAEHAIKQVEAGVDIIVAQGSEAGGHTGSISSMVLWPQVVDAVAPVPVLGAGGIGRGRQMAAAMALGCEGVWCGSIWLGTQQSELEQPMKQRLFAASAEQAIQSRAMTGKPCRMLRSGFSDAWESKDALPMPLQTLLTIESRLRINRHNITEHMGYPVGQIVGDMKHETTVRQVVYDLMAEYLEATDRLNQLVNYEVE